MYDLAFAAGVHVFASVGADGSVRMFDLRSLEHSTIIYESTDGQGGTPVPLIRLAWNKKDPNYLACITMANRRQISGDMQQSASSLIEGDQLHGARHDGANPGGLSQAFGCLVERLRPPPPPPFSP